MDRSDEILNLSTTTANGITALTDCNGTVFLLVGRDDDNNMDDSQLNENIISGNLDGPNLTQLQIVNSEDVKDLLSTIDVEGVVLKTSSAASNDNVSHNEVVQTETDVAATIDAEHQNDIGKNFQSECKFSRGESGESGFSPNELHDQSNISILGKTNIPNWAMFLRDCRYYFGFLI